MGNDRNEVEARGGRRARPPKATVPKGPLVNFILRQEDRENLAKGIYGPLEALETLEALCMDGHRISVGANRDRGGYFVIIREASSDWTKAAAVSFWGSTLARCFTQAGYYLTEINPDFPEGVQLPMFQDDW